MQRLQGLRDGDPIRSNLGADIIHTQRKLQQPIPKAKRGKETEDIAELEVDRAGGIDEGEDEGDNGEDQPREEPQEEDDGLSRTVVSKAERPDVGEGSRSRGKGDEEEDEGPCGFPCGVAFDLEGVEQGQGDGQGREPRGEIPQEIREPIGNERDPTNNLLMLRLGLRLLHNENRNGSRDESHGNQHKRRGRIRLNQERRPLLFIGQRQRVVAGLNAGAAAAATATARSNSGIVTTSSKVLQNRIARQIHIHPRTMQRRGIHQQIVGKIILIRRIRKGQRPIPARPPPPCPQSPSWPKNCSW